MPPLSLATGVLFGLLALTVTAGAVVDIRSQKIPNRLTYPAMAIMVALNGLFFGLPGLVASLAGLAGGLILFLVPYAFKLMGAGDVKMMAAVMAGLGAPALLTVFLFTSVAGGLLFVLSLAFTALFRKGEARRPRLSYGPAIAIGTLAAMAWRVFGNEYLVLQLPKLAG